MHPAIPFVVPFLLCAAATAQRGNPTFEWQKRTFALDYGMVPLGKHSLSELKIGDSWRFGFNEATTCTLTMPLLLEGGGVLPPGQYRLSLQRSNETTCALVFHGSQLALGGGADLQLTGPLGETSKPTKKFTVDLARDTAAAKEQKEAAETTVAIVAQFGKDQWSGKAAVAGNRTQKLGGYQLTVFALPEAPVAARSKTPVAVATLVPPGSKGAEGWNLFLNEQGCKLQPTMRSSQEQFGFGKIDPPDAALCTEGKVEVAESKAEKPFERLELQSASLKKGAIELGLAIGKETLTVRIAEPKAKE